MTKDPGEIIAGDAARPSPFAPQLEAFEAYWKEKRHGALVPRRSDIDPRGIEPLLSHAFVTERIAPGLARLRIAGGHLTDLMGMEVRGMPISAFLEPGARDALAHHLVCLFDQPATLRLTLSSAARPGAPALSGTMIMLPLRSDLGDVSRALGCLVTNGTIGRGPRRFEISHAEVTPLEGDGLPDAAPRLVSDSGPEDVPAQHVEPAARSASERPYLRLIKG
ncbi:PAS domain-containing protein [Roseovarius nanhaiticus]|uniref:PAS domain-containing protein n=1 Tax=Roseovarius nanhaiticus TaxID=573024 RepID=UPI002491D4D4|nr:PAS domain-containing protein [Roseovarius nanhaiticus]